MNIAGVRPRALLAGLVSATLISTLLPVPQAAAEPRSPHLAPQMDRPNSHGNEVTGGTAWAQRGQPQVTIPEPVWPSGTGQATLPPNLASGPSGVAAQMAATPVRAGSLPVWVRRAAGQAGQRLTGVTVQALDRAKAPAAWRDSLLLRLTGDGLIGEGEAVVSVNYDGFRYAYGAEWASRLRLWRVPECALTTPGRDGCGAVAVPSANDVPAGVVTGQLPIASVGGTLLAVAAGTAGSGGDFAATSLTPSSTWSAGGSSGDFSWSYGMRVPPAMGGPEPSLGLSYSSSSVDGRSAASNNQPSWVGEGFEYSPGYIERRYVPCAEDMEGDNHNNDRKTGDLCWRSDNAVMSLGGRSTELVFEQGKGWHARNEDGSRIEKLLALGNGDNDGEYWKVTDAAGVQYFFGRHSLPGHSDVTNSTATVRVYGNNPNDECYLAQFNLAHCNQAWRWNLDYVIDPRGNTMSLWYDKESNKYAANATDTEEVSYVRATVLRRIDYGTWDHGATDRSVTARAQVLFDPGDRCLSSCATHDAAHWPDVPWDLECTGDTCEGKFTPSFWTTKRLAKITTRVWDTSKATPVWQNVDSWTLTHSFPSPGDGTHAGLWLAKVVHAGHVGGTVTMPPLTFEPVAMPNRVLTPTNTTNNWQRLASVVSESGGKLQVTYSLPECTANNLPAQAYNNTKRCYPAIVIDPQDPQAERLITEWWHKYRVEHVSESDIQLTGAQPAPPKFTYYDYDNGTPAWHYADDDGLTNKNRKTWDQYRGYATVKVRTGDVAGQQTLTVTRYLRGMHGDRATPTGGTRTVTVPASLGGETVYDEDAFAGMARERVVYNGVESKPVEKSVMVPWQSPATASRTINGDTVSARFVNTRVTYRATALGVDGVRGWRTTRVQSTFDDAYGTESSVQDDGDLAVSGDEQCVSHTYNRNTGKNIVRLIKRSTAIALPCGQNPASNEDVISDLRLSYDGASSPDTVPAYGSVTKTEQLKSWTAAGGTVFQTVGQATFDAFGRAVTGTDIRGNTTKITYIPANAPVAGTKSVSPSPYNWETVTEIAPYWGAVKKVTDPNERVSEAEFDAAGRVSKVWDAGWTRADHPAQPTAEYTYNFAPGRDAYPYVTTKALHAGGGYRTSYQIYDGLLRPRQTQTAAVAGGGRMVSDTLYDKLGRPATTYAKHVEPGTASGALWHEPEWSVPAVTKTLYDNAGRPKAEVFYGSDGVTNLVEKWRTTITYLGDQVAVTPPDGAIPTTTVSDAHGRVTELRQHTTAAGVDGAYDITRYAYNRKSQLIKVTDPALNEWTYEYDIKGRRLQTNDPDRGRITNTFTDHDDLATTADARGEVIAYSYDQLGRRTGSYDDVVSAATKRTEWKYDQLYTGATVRGQLTEAIRYDPPGSANTYKWQVRQFTARYQPSGVNYVIPGTETGISGTWVIGQNYSQFDGSPTEVVYPEGGGLAAETVTTAYDTATGLPSTLNTNLPGTSSYVSLQQYTPFGEPTLTQRKIGGGVYVEDATHYEETTRRVTRTTVLAQTAAGTVADRSYKYLPAGTVTEISDTPQVGSADTQCFGHDRLARLTSAWTPKAGVVCGTAPSVGNLGGPAPYWLDWTFDKTGNRLTEVSHATTGDTKREFAVPNGGAGVVRPHAVTTVTTTPPGGPAVTRGFSYDSTGNTTARTGPTGAAQTLAWDAEGRLSTVTENSIRVAGNVYDADGGRLIRRDAAGTTLYLPGMEIRKPTGLGTATATRYYSFGGRLIASRTPGAQALTWLYTDHQGTQQTTVNAYTQQVTTRRQTPYGEPRGPQSAWPNEKGFVGGDNDPTGLTHLGARQYDPALGRFISVDPIMDLTDPQQWNGYAYGNNTPVTVSDPTGLLGSASCANGTAQTGSACTGGEGSQQAPDSGGWKSKTTTLPNGTELHQEGGRSYINGADVTDGLRLKGAPTALDFARGIDRYIGKNPDLAWMLFDDEGLGFLISNAWKHYGVKSGTHFHWWTKSVDPRFADAMTSDSMGPAGMGSGFGGFRGRGPGGSTRKPTWTRRNTGGSCAVPDPNSFVPGTQVLMGDGKLRPIEDVAPGDAVMATDPITGKTEARTVTATITGEGEKHLVAITLDTDGAAGGATATVTATDEHPFWLPERQEWVVAIDLTSGGWLQTSAGTWVQITAVSQRTQPSRVHNLTVDGLHTYYVLAGNTPVLVHNDTDYSTVIAREVRVIATGHGTLHTYPDGSTDTYLGTGPEAKTSPNMAKKWAGSDIYEVRGYGNLRILVNRHGDVGWVDKNEGNYKNIRSLGVKIDAIPADWSPRCISKK